MKKVVSFYQMVNEGHQIPKGWGIAYSNWDMTQAVCYPLPFNWIIGWGRNIWFKLMHGPKDRFRAALSTAEQRGYERGELVAFRKLTSVFSGSKQ